MTPSGSASSAGAPPASSAPKHDGAVLGVAVSGAPSTGGRDMTMVAAMPASLVDVLVLEVIPLLHGEEAGTVRVADDADAVPGGVGARWSTTSPAKAIMAPISASGP